MRLFSLPAEGWVGTVPPVPPLDFECDSNNYMINGLDSASDMPLIPCRIQGKQASEFLLELWEEVDNGGLTPIQLTEVVQFVISFLPESSLYFRKTLFSETDEIVGFNLDAIHLINRAEANEALKQGLKQGGKIIAKIGAFFGLKAFVKDFVTSTITGKDHRAHPAILFGSALYLKQRMENECPTDTTIPCINIPEGVVNNLENLIARTALIPVIDDLYLEDIDEKGELTCKDRAASHGAAFELLVTANFHMRHEQLNLVKYELLGSQDSQKPALWKLSRDTGFNKLDPDDSLRMREDIYTRNADIAIKGSGSKTVVELKSYPINTQSNGFIGKDSGSYSAKSSSYNTKIPLWNANNIYARRTFPNLLKKKRKGTTMHRQLILDYLLTLRNLDISGDLVQSSADDFLWLFQDWTVARDSDKENQINKKRGVSMIGANAIVGSNSISGEEYIKRRMSKIGTPGNSKTKESADTGRAVVAFNLGLTRSEASNTAGLYGPLYSGISSNVNGDKVLPLKDRIKMFSGLGLEASLPGDSLLTEAERDMLLENIFDIEKGDPLYDAVINGVTTTLEQHIENYDELKEEAVKQLTEEVLGEENAKVLEEYIEVYEEFSGDFEAYVEEKFPDFGDKDLPCQ